MAASNDEAEANGDEEEASEEEQPHAADDDEVVAEINGVLEELVEEGHLELASRRRGARFLASPLFTRLDRDKEVNIADWLVDRNEVSELYLDADEVAERFRGVLARMAGKKSPEKFHPELAEAIAKSPDDDQAWSVYADWLLEQGDPRGELMAMQILRARKGKDGDGKEEKPDPVIAQKEEALLARHRRHFYGDLAVAFGDEDRSHVSFRNGFFDAATVSSDVGLETLLGLESSRFLRKLVVECKSLDPVNAVLERKQLPKTLAELAMRSGPSRYDISGAGTLDASSATRGLERLEHLSLRAKIIRVSSRIEAPRLRQLILRGDSLVFEASDVLDGLRALERLVINASKLTTAGALEALFANPPPKLTRLAVCNITSVKTSHRLVEVLVGSRLAKQIQQLDLRRCGLRDRDGELLLAHKADLTKLQAVDLRGNTLLPTIAGRLEAQWSGKVDRNDDDEEDDDSDDDERYEDNDE